MNPEWNPLKPLPLTSNGTIAVIALSDVCNARQVKRYAKRFAEECGSGLSIGLNLSSNIDNYSAGTTLQKYTDLMRALTDPDVRVIIGATGGYSLLYVLKDFGETINKTIKDNPKLFVGYSDNDLFGNWVQASARITSLCGPSMWGMYDWDDASRTHLRNLIKGEQDTYEINHDTNWRTLRHGTSEGVLVTSNLDTLLRSMNTAGNPLRSIDGRIILVVEEFGIPLDDLRMQLQTLFMNPDISKVSGFVFGRSPGIQRGPYPLFAQRNKLEDILRDVVPINVPSAILEDYGHAEWDGKGEGYKPRSEANKRFIAIPRGVWARLNVGKVTSLVYDSPVCPR
jgi:muramoyltetrapeptide carboxypeptidase LdcA involved in peptidoglycan recycling